MRLLLMTFLLILFATQRTLSADVIEPTESILIYQDGRLLSIGLENQEIKEVGQFSPDLIILWSDYDEISNRIYAIVENEPFNYQIGKQLRSVVSLDLTSQKEESLYAEDNLLLSRLVSSPDRSKLLIYQYELEKIDSSITPTKPQVCILSIARRSCQTILLPGFTNEFNWLNEHEFLITNNGSLYICYVETLNCEKQTGLEDIYIRSAIRASIEQILVTGSLYPSDGTSHFYDFDLKTQEHTELEQLRKTPIFDDKGISIMQDHITSLYFSADNKYLMAEGFRSDFAILELSTGVEKVSFQGSRPQWVGGSHTFVDNIVQDGRTEVYAFNVDTGTKTTLYTTDEPFHLIVP